MIASWHSALFAITDWARRLDTKAHTNAMLLKARGECLHRALWLSMHDAVVQIEGEFRDLNIRVIAAQIVQLLIECLGIMVTTTALGATLGGIIGFFGGAGVGAAPGAAEGAVLGAELGQWILAAMGLAGLIEFVAQGLPTIGRDYWDGLCQAWLAAQPGPVTGGQPHVDSVAVRRAASILARAHVAMVVLLLTAIVAYLSKGRGSMSGLAESASKGRLGRKFGDWLLQNETRLKEHPRLRPAAPLRNEAPATPEAASTGRSQPRPAPKPAETEPTAPTPMPRKRLPCFKTQKLPPGKFAEMDRQLAGQQRALNKMTVQDYLDGRARYAADGLKGAAKAALQAREEHKAEWIDKLTDTHQQNGLDAGTAKSLAREQVSAFMTTQNALHAPDMVAGGQPDAIDGLGDGEVNRTIGRQWNNGAATSLTRVGHLDAAAHAIPVEARKTTLMRVELHRCP